MGDVSSDSEKGENPFTSDNFIQTGAVSRRGLIQELEQEIA